MVRKTHEFSHPLRAHGLRSTESARCLLTLLKNLEGPATAKMIHDRLEGRGCDLATVHRLLGRLERAGLVQGSHLKGKSRWYELAEEGRHYHHMICRRCGNIDRFGYCAIATLSEKVRQESGFGVESHSVELFGLCRRCGQKRHPGGDRTK